MKGDLRFEIRTWIHLYTRLGIWHWDLTWHLPITGPDNAGLQGQSSSILMIAMKCVKSVSLWLVTVSDGKQAIFTDAHTQYWSCSMWNTSHWWFLAWFQLTAAVAKTASSHQYYADAGTVVDFSEIYNKSW